MTHETFNRDSFSLIYILCLLHASAETELVFSNIAATNGNVVTSLLTSRISCKAVGSTTNLDAYSTSTVDALVQSTT